MGNNIYSILPYKCTSLFPVIFPSLIPKVKANVKSKEGDLDGDKQVLLPWQKALKHV